MQIKSLYSSQSFSKLKLAKHEAKDDHHIITTNQKITTLYKANNR
jgi:hypothetical protein